MVVTADAELARKVRLLRNQGMERRYENEIVGYNNRMTDMHAAIGRVQLGRLAGWTAQRQANARFLDSSLEGVVVPPVAPGAMHVYHQYTIRVPGDRDAFAARLAERGRRQRRLLPDPEPPAALLRARRSTCRRPSARPREVLSLPVHPALSGDDLKTIVEAVNATAAEAG